MYLEDLLDLLEDIDERGYQMFMDEVMSDSVEMMQEQTARLNQSYGQHKGRFDEIVARNAQGLATLKNALAQDQAELARVKSQKESMRRQVVNLETISSKMPDWCHTSRNANEIGGSVRRTDDISEES